MYHLSHMCLIKCSLAGKWHGSEENWERGRLSRARVGWPKFLHCSLPSHSSCLTADCERNLKLVLLVLLPAQHCPMHALPSACYHEARPPEASDARPYDMQIVAGIVVQACSAGKRKDVRHRRRRVHAARETGGE